MKREDWLAKGYTEEQVTDLLNSFHAVNSENQKLKENLTKSKELETKYNDLQKMVDEINKEKLSEQEKLELEKAETEKKLAEANKIYNTAKVKEILAGLNVNEKLLNTLVTSDEETSIANANEFKAQFENYKTQIVQETKESIVKTDVKPNPTNVPQEDDTMTKEKFLNMSMTSQKMWKDENPDQYHEMFD